MRLSYKQWLNVLSNIMFPPKIKSFVADKTAIINGMSITLKWEVENAHTVEIDNNVGNVNGKTEITLRPNKDVVYKIKAIGEFGEDEKIIEIKLFPTPVLESLKVPIPDFVSKINLDLIQINPPQINVSINFNLMSNEPIFTESPKELKILRPQHMPRAEFLNLSSEENIKRNIKITT